MRTIQQFCNTYRIHSEAKMVGENPNCPDWTDAYHYRVTLRTYRPLRQLTVHFSMGYGHSREPEAFDVLECLAMDYYDKQETFEGWAENLGYNTDSRKAERTYRACVEQAEKLERFLGDEKLQELLECEE